jgi:hypothetical protein
MSVGSFTIAPLRSFNNWRQLGSSARSVHPILYYVWCVLGTPFWFFGCVGAVFCFLTFPSMLLGLGLSFVNNKPSIGWWIYAACIILLWTLLYVIQMAGVLRQARSAILDIEGTVVILIMSLSYALACWYVSHQIGLK